MVRIVSTNHRCWVLSTTKQWVAFNTHDKILISQCGLNVTFIAPVKGKGDIVGKFQRHLTTCTKRVFIEVVDGCVTHEHIQITSIGRSIDVWLVLLGLASDDGERSAKLTMVTQ